MMNDFLSQLIFNLYLIQPILKHIKEKIPKELFKTNNLLIHLAKN